MSYRVTVYFTDECIASTTLRSGSFISETGYYGDDYYSGTGFAESTKFTANPASGCEFTRWVYRVGSVTATQQYSYANPFTYSGTEDIYIRAEGKTTSGGGGGGDDDDDDDTWKLVNRGSLGTITEQQDIEINIESYKVYRFAFQFAYDGVPTFYTTGDVYTYGQWTDDTASLKASTGETTSYIAQNHGGGDGNNFRIRSTKNPATANTTYYIWVSGYSGDDTGPSTLHIVPPSEPATETVEKWNWNASNGSANATLTSNAYDAVVNRKATTNFSHLVWNDMVDKVHDVIKAYASYADWESSYASYNDTKMNSAPYYLTAVKFNSIRNNIEIIGNYINLGYHTDIGKVDSGDYVNGDYFLILAEYINDCIDNLQGAQI